MTRCPCGIIFDETVDYDGKPIPLTEPRRERCSLTCVVRYANVREWDWREMVDTEGL